MGKKLTQKLTALTQMYEKLTDTDNDIIMLQISNTCQILQYSIVLLCHISGIILRYLYEDDHAVFLFHVDYINCKWSLIQRFYQ